MDVELLSSLAAEAYAPWRILGPRDDEIMSLVSSVSSVSDYKRLNSELRLDSARVLTAFASRAASWGVRVERRFPIYHGIVAALLAARVEDDREIIIVLSLLYRAAELINADPATMLDQASRVVGQHALGIARDFANREPQDRSITAMGYIEIRDKYGFRFHSAW